MRRGIERKSINVLPHGQQQVVRCLVSVMPFGHARSHWVNQRGINHSRPNMQLSTVALSDETGVGTTRYAYSPFGTTTIAGTSSNPFQFKGRVKRRERPLRLPRAVLQPVAQPVLERRPDRV